jgi:signal transduction histidine kinase
MLSKSKERMSAHIRSLRKLLNTLSGAHTSEQVFAYCLSSIHDISEPNNAYVVLPEPGMKGVRGAPEQTYQPGWTTDLTVPVMLEGEVAGQFVLHFDSPRALSDVDLNLIETIATLAAFSLARIHECEHFKDALQKKTEAVAMAVHELRAPLTTILGAASLLESARQEQREEAAALISRNARAQEQFIADLLNLTQLDAGKTPLRLAVMDVTTIVEQVVEEIRPVAANASISITTQLDRPIMVRGDAQRLWQIFWNLLSNSVRFVSPNGRIQVIATGKDGFATICVRDDGCGIQPERIERIFERFEQVHNARLRRYDGFGLGLAVVKELVSMLGGTVTAHSDGLGKGAQFTVRLPHVP